MRSSTVYMCTYRRVYVCVCVYAEEVGHDSPLPIRSQIEAFVKVFSNS